MSLGSSSSSSTPLCRRSGSGAVAMLLLLHRRTQRAHTHTHSARAAAAAAAHARCVSDEHAFARLPTLLLWPLQGWTIHQAASAWIQHVCMLQVPPVGDRLRAGAGREKSVWSAAAEKLLSKSCHEPRFEAIADHTLCMDQVLCVGIGCGGGYVRAARWQTWFCTLPHAARRRGWRAGGVGRGPCCSSGGTAAPRHSACTRSWAL